MTAFEPGKTSHVRRIVRWLFASAVVIVLLAGLWFVAAIRADQPVAYDDVAEHFKYGSIGSEPGVSLLNPVGGTLPPYWIFKALPNVCREKLRLQVVQRNRGTPSGRQRGR